MGPEMTKLADALRRAVQRGAVSPSIHNAERLMQTTAPAGTPMASPAGHPFKPMSTGQAQDMLAALQQPMGPEIWQPTSAVAGLQNFRQGLKIAGRLHERCPHCGIKHAGKHNHTMKAADFEDEHGLYNPLPKKPKQPTGPEKNEGPKKPHGPEMKKLSAMLSPMQQHAASDAWRAHAQAPVSTQMPMRMNPQEALARQQMLQNPQMFAGGGGAPSGLELAARPPMMKRSQLELLREKVAIAPLVAGGLLAAGRAALPAIARTVAGAGSKMMASPVGNMVGQQAMGMGMQMGAQKLMQPKQQGPLPGQIGGV